MNNYLLIKLTFDARNIGYMNETKNVLEFLRLLEKSVEKKSFRNGRLYNKRDKNGKIKQILGRPTIIKDAYHISIVERTDTQDTTKNMLPDDFIDFVGQAIFERFFIAEFETDKYQYFLTTYPNGKAKLRHKVINKTEEISLDHNKKKERFITAEENEYLKLLEISTSNYVVKNKAQDKFKQINKYVEIIHDILKRKDLDDGARIVDMGSGKGYLTFALYDYFQKFRKQTPVITGIEMREELVEKCNSIAAKCGFQSLDFKKQMIHKVDIEKMDMLIALHACDTATDDAIFKGIQAESQIIICAPCCHKQVRKRLNPTNRLDRITRHGILKERQAEILTDTIRAMILEAHGYKTRVFEFISTSHTPKNVLIVGILDDKVQKPDPEILAEIKALRELWGISFHYLERLVTEN